MEVIPTIDREQLVRDVTARASNLRDLLSRHVAQARQVVRLLLEGRLVSEPFDNGKEHGYKFKAMGTYRRLGVPAMESLVNVGGGPNGNRRRDC